MRSQLVLLAALAYVQATVYDVTSIYRLTAGLEDGVAAKIEGSQKASCLVASSVCEGWTKQGWTQTDSGLSGVTFPASDQLPGDRNATLQRAATGVFDVSVASRGYNRGGNLDEQDPVYMVFSTGINETDSDLLVLRMDSWKGVRVSAFRCLLGQFGKTLSFPDGTQRKCSEFAQRNIYRSADTDSEQYRISLAPENLKVQRISDLQVLFDITNVNQLKDIKFFRMIAEDDDVQHTKAVSVLSLTAMSGRLSSGLLSHRNSAAICVSFSAFVDPRSGGSLTVTAQYEGGQRLPLGRVFVAEDESSRKAESWKFSTLVDPSEKRRFRIDVQADKLADFPVLIADLSRCAEPERAEAHARTNARGLPFLLSDGKFADPDVGVAFKGCNSQGCPWEKKNWNLTSIKTSPALGGTDQDLRSSVTSGSNFTDLFRFNSGSVFSVRPFNVQYSNYNNYLSVFLMAEDLNSLYAIRLHGGRSSYSGYPAELFKCGSNYQISYYQFTGSDSLPCRHMATSQKPSQYAFSGMTNPLVISASVVRNRVVVNVDRHTIFDWNDPSDPFDVRLIKFGTRQMAAQVTATSVFAVQRDDGVDDNGMVLATMTSPAFYTGAKRACVVVHYYTDDAKGSVGVTARTSDGLVTATADRTETADVNGQSGLIEGWHRDTFEVALSGGQGPHFIALEAEKSGKTSLWVQRIAGCNLQDDEDVRVFANDSSLVIVQPGFEVPAFDRAASLTNKKCSHGGRVVNGNLTECVCPAGFTGENCERGCGANRYGADCRGRCSATGRGCRGMLLCQALLGCACGPGLTGPLCDKPCRRGEFGAGCAQACGHCAGSSLCDIHTGECLDGCQDGFYPPLCEHKYKTLSAAPIAKALKDTWKITFNLDRLDGKGQAMFYIVQYRREGASWSSLPTRPVSPGVVEAELPVLPAGRRHQARVVLVDRDGGSYQADDVPFASFNTACEVSTMAVDLTSENVTETSFVLTWKPLAEVPGICPTTGYQLWVKMGWEWQTMELGSDSTGAQLGGVGTLTEPGNDDILMQLLPGHSYPVLIRALSESGPAPFSTPKAVATLNSKPVGRVSDLHTTSTAATELKVSWSPPTNGPASKFKLDYQCVLLLACPESNCSESRGSLETSDLSATLTGLEPLARYKVTVATLPSMATHPATLMTSTSAKAPSVAPAMAALPVVARGNTSLTVQWKPVASCAALHGFAASYAVELWRAPLLVPVAKETAKIGHERASFEGLEPHTNYTVKVFVVTSSGSNNEFPLEFVAKTRATTPGPVQALAVYKRGRRMLGLRWAAPSITYGPLRSFTVTHVAPGSSSQSTVFPPMQNVIALTPCIAWPDMFCHTIDKLQSDTKYKVTVQAQNTEVDEDGEEESVLAITKEGTPTVPSTLRLAGASSTELTVQWNLPDLVNGQLRSFLVTIEQTDSANATNCCQDFPMREVVVKTEEPSYQLQLPRLLPASTYLLSVSAKTVALGPSASVTGQTRPSAPEMPAPPIAKAAGPLSLAVDVQPAPQHNLLSGQLLLLAIADGFEPNSTIGLNIFDPWLATGLASINTTLYLAAEFTQDDAEDGSLTITPGEDPVRGHFGVIQVPPLLAGTLFQLVQVTVLDYCGMLGFGFARSNGVLDLQ